MSAPRRLDTELVRRGLARSRNQAGALVRGGRVRIDAGAAVRPATLVGGDQPIYLRPGQDWVSRAGHKLAGAVRDVGAIHIRARRCLDAGASTGGFTEVLLHEGADEVIAVDVGHDQLAAVLRTDPRVTVLEGSNVRDLTATRIGGQVDLTVADLSFISLRLVLAALTACTRADGDLLLMVKPQFEVGRERLGAGGVVREAPWRAGAVLDVADAAWSRGWGTAAVAASRLPGPAGNLETFLWLRRDAPAPRPAAVTAATGDLREPGQ